MSAATLRLDLQSDRPARWRFTPWALLVLSVVAALLLVRAGMTLRDEVDVLSDRHETLQRRLHPTPSRDPSPSGDPQTAARIARANVVIDELAVPWNELFDAVESAHVKGLSLLSLLPNAQDRSLRLSAQARSMAQVLAYVDRVAQQPTLQQVHLLGYETVASDGVSVVQFTLAAQWKRR